jgi:hypothetical protein
VSITETDTALTPEDVARHFGDGYQGIEILADGRVRKLGTGAEDEAVTRTLKTERTWY